MNNLFMLINLTMLINVRKIFHVDHPKLDLGGHHRALARLNALFVDKGWQIVNAGGPPPDLLIERGPVRYAVEVKAAPDARRDRLIPLLAQALFEAQSFARIADAAPLAVIAAPRIPRSLAADLIRFAEQHAPGIAIGLLDLEGGQHFVGDDEGLRGLSAVPERLARASSPRVERPQELFSDLNQWMLKVLLAPRIPAEWLNAPRGEYRNVSEWARAASVSVMHAFRFQKRLLEEGFLDEAAAVLRLVRLPELFRLWHAAYLKPVRDLPMRFLLPGRDRAAQLREALRRYGANEEQPRVCLAMFAAADALGLGYVHGVPPHLYLERIRPNSLYALGLAPVAKGEQVDVFVRLPRARKSVFRGAIDRNGVLISDALQVWLDVAEHPARGAEQAEQVWKAALSGVVSAT